MFNAQGFDQFLQKLLDPGVELFLFTSFLKVMFLLGFGIYILFAGMVVKQIFMMTKTIQTPLAPFLKIFGLGYLVLSIIVFFFVTLI